MTLDFGDKPKLKKRVLPKINAKEITKLIRLLSGGLSFGGGILGCMYLLNLGIPAFGVGVFGVGVVIVHILYLKSEADN